MVIDTNDVQIMENYANKKKILEAEKLNTGRYTANDIALVRTTNHLSTLRCLRSISDEPFVCKINDLLSHAVFEELVKEDPISAFDIEKVQHLTKKSKDYCPYNTQYRSSIHFCLNGLVASHGSNNFDNKDYIIIEPFAAHQNDPNLLSVRAEDTYFQKQVILSNDAVVLITEDRLKSLPQNIKDQYNIVAYRGDAKQATECILIDMGIVPEEILTDYAEDSATLSLLNQFVDQKGYNTEKHVYSKNYIEDDEKSVILWEMYHAEFYNYLFDSIGYEKDDRVAKLVKASPYDQEGAKLLTGIIDDIGLDNLKEKVDLYNSVIKEKISLGVYPTNQDLLNGARLDIVDAIDFTMQKENNCQK